MLTFEEFLEICIGRLSLGSGDGQMPSELLYVLSMLMEYFY